MRAVVIVVMLVSCHRPEPKFVAPPAVAPQGPPGSSAPAITMASTQSDLGRLRSMVKSDPVAVMYELGVTNDEFEPIAHAMFLEWRRLHPTQTKEGQRSYLPTPTQTPSPMPSPMPVIAQPVAQPSTSAYPKGWWCFKASADDWGDCSVTKVDCEDARAKLVDVGVCKSMTGASRDDCVDIAAGSRHVTACEFQQRAACFTVHMLLQNEDGGRCAPLIDLCIKRREFVMKTLSRDIKVTSTCHPAD